MSSLTQPDSTVVPGQADVVPVPGILRPVNDDFVFRQLQSFHTNVVATLVVAGNTIGSATPGRSPAFRSKWGSIFRSGKIHRIQVHAACAPYPDYLYHLALCGTDSNPVLWNAFRNLPVHQFVYGTDRTSPILSLDETEFPYSREVLSAGVTSAAVTTLMHDGKPLEIDSKPVTASTRLAIGSATGLPLVRVLVGAQGSAVQDEVVTARCVFYIEFSAPILTTSGYSD